MYRRLLPYALVILLGYIGFSLPLPLLPEMFLDPSHGILAGNEPISHKMLILGLIMASFPLGQFFGSPFLGHFSDRYGRKKVILISLTGTLIGYLLTATFVEMRSVVGMFLGLAFCGFCEGNVTIAQSVIADITEAEHKSHEKARYFGWLNIFVAAGFIIGPLMGGQLADKNLVSWFSYATPFWMAALLTLIGIVMIYLLSKETLIRRKAKEWNFLSSVTSGWKKPSLRMLYSANFFLALGYFAYFRFLPVFLERRFGFTPVELGYVMVYDAIIMALGVIFIIPRLATRWSPVKQLWVFSILLAVSFIVCILPNNPYALILTIPPVGVFLAVTITNGSLVISNAASSEFQGQALGTLTSVQVSAEFLTGILGGVMAAEVVALPLYVGAAMAVVCSLILYNER